MIAAIRYGKRTASVRMSRGTADLALRTNEVKARSFSFDPHRPAARWQDAKPNDESFARAIDGLFQPAADFLRADGETPGLVEFLGPDGEVIALLRVA